VGVGVGVGVGDAEGEGDGDVCGEAGCDVEDRLAFCAERIAVKQMAERSRPKAASAELSAKCFRRILALSAEHPDYRCLEFKL
jgi:hypothetical protein